MISRHGDKITLRSNLMKLSTVIFIKGIILSIYNTVLMHATHLIHLCASHADSVVLYQHTLSGTVFRDRGSSRWLTCSGT